MRYLLLLALKSKVDVYDVAKDCEKQADRPAFWKVDNVNKDDVVAFLNKKTGKLFVCEAEAPALVGGIHVVRWHGGG